MWSLVTGCPSVFTVPTFYDVLSKSKKRIRNFHMKIVIFTALKMAHIAICIGMFTYSTKKSSTNLAIHFCFFQQIFPGIEYGARGLNQSEITK